MTPFLRTTAALLLLAPLARAADADHFESKIRPVLVEHCYSCHSEDAAKAKKLKGGLKLDTRDATRNGRERCNPEVSQKVPKVESTDAAPKYDTVMVESNDANIAVPAVR